MPRDKIEFVKNVILKQIVKGYMIEDLKRLIAIPVIPNTAGNCNFPIALYTLSCMDFLGYLIAQPSYSLWGKDTIKRIEAYIDMTFTAPAKKEFEPNRSKFIEKFRHGLSHEFFPKNSGVSRIRPKEKATLMWKLEADLWILDADLLSSYFIDSVVNLESIIKEADLCDRIYERYIKIQQNNSPSPPPTILSQGFSPTAWSSNATIPDRSYEYTPDTSGAAPLTLAKELNLKG